MNARMQITSHKEAAAGSMLEKYGEGALVRICASVQHAWWLLLSHLLPEAVPTLSLSLFPPSSTSK